MAVLMHTLRKVSSLTLLAALSSGCLASVDDVEFDTSLRSEGLGSEVRHAVATGSSHSLMRTSSGKVLAWGSDSSGQLGNGNEPGPGPVYVKRLKSPEDPPQGFEELVNVLSVSAGDCHSLALTAEGKVYAWGCDSDGQLGNGADGPSTFAREVLSPGGGSPLRIVAIAAGGSDACRIAAKRSRSASAARVNRGVAKGQGFLRVPFVGLGRRGVLPAAIPRM